MMDGKLIIKDHSEQHYRTLFHQGSGFFVRKEDEGYPEPTWSADGPELIDLSITSYCQKGCSFCYRKANATTYQHLSIEDIASVVEQAKACGTLQIALGGGNPNEHPQFVEITRLIRENGIVPSYTTNGDGLNDIVLKTTAEYCGAMAISVYAPYNVDFYESILKKVRDYGIKVNLHAIIRSDTLDMWSDWLLNPPVFIKYVNAVVFLNYKPIGKCGESFIPTDIGKVEKFFRAANKCKCVKVGFDSCSISGIVQWMNVPEVLVESCEASRFSCFISEDMKMYPCSFMVERDWYGDLRKQSLIDIWRSNPYFCKYRTNFLPSRCQKCQYSKICKGGCQFIEQINLCKATI